MLKKILFVVVAVLVPISLFAQTTGKIAGTVTDRETGDPLPGANVVVEGTTLGAATDINGNYVILNVPVGTYAVRASFIGYETVTVRNIRVSIGLTTELNFELPSEALEVGEIEVVAERPLVNKNATNTIKIVSSEDIENLPVRGYANVAGLQGGVVQVGGTLYVRGGRPEEVQFYVDGVSQNDPFTLNRAGDLINNSIEEVQVQTGGFNAEYGFANSGIIQVTTKTGGSDYQVSGEIITDEFLGDDSETLGAFGYGYNIRNIAFSGPVPSTDKAKFYFAIENSDFDDSRRSAGVHPVRFDSTTNQVITRGGPLPNNGLERWNWNGNILLDFRPLQFKIGGNSTRDEGRNYIHSFSLFNNELNPRTEREVDSYFLKATHTVGSNTFWTATASWFRSEFRQGDPRFFEDVEAYGDTSRNPALPLPGNNPRTNDLHARFRPEGTTFGVWQKSKSTYFALRADLTHQSGRLHEFKAGFETRFHTIRRYQVFPLRIASARAANPGASTPDVYRSAFAANIGYDVTGQTEVNDGIDRARKPTLAAVYVQDKLEFSDLVLNLGLRWDYFATDAPTFEDPTNVEITEGGFIDPAQLGEEKTYSDLNPRIGISFPVTDRTVFHAQYGKFTQPPELDRLYIAYTDFANNLQAGNFTTSENPELRPVRTTAYEVGFRQQIGDNAALDVTAYYKELRDLVQARNIQAQPVAYAAFVNGDYGTVKGVSATFQLRRTKRVAMSAQYTLQFAGGTGSAANDAFAINWLGNPPVYPTFVAPLDFDQRHTGAINFDFRTTATDVVGRAGLNLLLTFHSGRPYTPGQMRSAVFATGPSAQNQPVAAINSATMPFFINLDAKLDKSFTVGNVDFNVYLWVINLLDNEGVRNVYEQNGEPDTDGWLQTPQGEAFAAQAPSAASFYRARVNSPFNFEEPRQYRLGVRFNIK